MPESALCVDGISPFIHQVVDGHGTVEEIEDPAMERGVRYRVFFLSLDM